MRADSLALKQHRVEIGLAMTTVIAVAVVAVAIAFVFPSSKAVAASYVVGAMKVLPFAIGLISGIPIVSREYEDRTAQMAWSLYASRARWLVHQAGPVLVVVAIGTAIAAFAVLPAISYRWTIAAEQEFFDIGTSGAPAVARWLGAFGIGLLVGALLRRALPALAVAAVICLAVLALVGAARDVWLTQQGPLFPVDDGVSVVQSEWAFLAPDGRQLSVEEVQALAPVGDEDREKWLATNGYSWVGLGVQRNVAMRWAWYDELAFVVVGLSSIGATVVIVNRSRPD